MKSSNIFVEENKIESLTVNSVRDFKFVFYLSLSIYYIYEIEIELAPYLLS